MNKFEEIQDKSSSKEFKKLKKNLVANLLAFLNYIIL